MEFAVYALAGCCFLLTVIILFLAARLKNAMNNDKLNEIEKGIAVQNARLSELNKSNVLIFQTVDRQLTEIRTDNERKLERIRQTVEEKLESTLDRRLTASFRTVGDQLEKVYTQIGEMQNLAKGVDSLERVLTNVKTRGIWGELQAEKILQEILTPDQYMKNVATKHDSADRVEFAVKLPRSLMPIDSKFPREDYERLCVANEKADPEGAAEARKALFQRINAEARKISEKYIDVPYTTDFAIMFLPIEGLYAEILSEPGFHQMIQNNYHILIAGPSTLASLLNSLQMGFHTLAIEKKSAEVWHVLGEVKTEFVKFEDVMKKVQDRLNSASKEVDSVFQRQRVMSRKLDNVELPEHI